MADVHAIDWPALARAVADDDIDAALSQGLLDWDGDAASPRDAGVGEGDIVRLMQVRVERISALAARDRHRARDARLARLQAERRQRQAPQPQTETASPMPALPGAAAAALARALVKAKR